MAQDKKIEDYLHLYLGCEVRYDYLAGRLVGVHSYYAVIDMGQLGIIKIVPGLYSILKPILRPLSDMSEEEMKELYMKQFGQSEDIAMQVIDSIKFYPDEIKRHIKRGEGVGYSTFKKDGSHYSTGTLSYRSLTSEQLLYLLSKHFDLFGLIEAGLAIDKTK